MLPTQILTKVVLRHVTMPRFLEDSASEHDQVSSDTQNSKIVGGEKGIPTCWQIVTLFIYLFFASPARAFTSPAMQIPNIISVYISVMCEHLHISISRAGSVSTASCHCLASPSLAPLLPHGSLLVVFFSLIYSSPFSPSCCVSVSLTCHSARSLLPIRNSHPHSTLPSSPVGAVKQM